LGMVTILDFPRATVLCLGYRLQSTKWQNTLNFGMGI